MHNLRQTATEASIALLGDGKILHDILALAGPDVAPRLLLQIVADLTATSDQLGRAITSHDLGAIRAQSHVLISLAGTLGAMGLHRDACCLNEAAHAQDLARIDGITPRLTAELSALVALVESRSAKP